MSQTNNFGNGNIGSVQIGGTNNSAANQLNIGINGHELAQLADSLRQEVAQLPPAERKDAEEVVEGIIEEASKENPRQSFLSALTKALPVAIQNAPALIELMSKLASS